MLLYLPFDRQFGSLPEILSVHSASDDNRFDRAVSRQLAPARSRQNSDHQLEAICELRDCVNCFVVKTANATLRQD